jgi:hypothetical protein
MEVKLRFKSQGQVEIEGMRGAVATWALVVYLFILYNIVTRLLVWSVTCKRVSV